MNEPLEARTVMLATTTATTATTATTTNTTTTTSTTQIGKHSPDPVHGSRAWHSTAS
jgi:hypothetical protein